MDNNSQISLIFNICILFWWKSIEIVYFNVICIFNRIHKNAIKYPYHVIKTQSTLFKNFDRLL